MPPPPSRCSHAPVPRPKIIHGDKPVDRWHTDTTPFVTVLFLVDEALYEGGRFEYLHCTKEKAATMLKSGTSLGSCALIVLHTHPFLTVLSFFCCLSLSVSMSHVSICVSAPSLPLFLPLYLSPSFFRSSLSVSLPFCVYKKSMMGGCTAAP